MPTPRSSLGLLLLCGGLALLGHGLLMPLLSRAVWPGFDGAHGQAPISTPTPAAARVRWVRLQAAARPAVPAASPPSPSSVSRAVGQVAARPIRKQLDGSNLSIPVADAVLPSVSGLTPVVLSAAAPSPVLSVLPTQVTIEPRWPRSSRLDYAVLGHYRGEVHGDAQVEWLRQGHHYRMRLELAIGPRWTPWVRRSLQSEGVLSPLGVQPRHYEEQTQWLWSAARRWQRDLGQVALPPDVAGPLQDSASQFVQLAWGLASGRIPLRAGQRVDLPLVLGQGVRGWAYELVGETTVQTPAGDFEAWHVRPLVADPQGALLAEMWLAPALQFLPVRLRIWQGDATSVQLTLRELPLQEAPPDNEASPTETAP